MRRIPLVDWLTYLGIPTMAVVVGAVTALLTPSWTFGKTIALAVFLFFFVVIGVSTLLGRLATPPTYVTKQGVAVWSYDGGPHRAEIELGLDVFIRHVFTAEAVRMLESVRMEFQPHKLGTSRWGWRTKDLDGVQSGNAALMRWEGSLETSLFFHELMHIYDELVRSANIVRWQPDQDHREPALWVHEGEMCEEYARYHQRRKKE
jgi:hypothetical protein